MIFVTYEVQQGVAESIRQWQVGTRQEHSPVIFAFVIVTHQPEIITISYRGFDQVTYGGLFSESAFDFLFLAIQPGSVKDHFGTNVPI